MRWRPVEVRYMPTEDLGRPLSSLGLDSDAEKNHIEFLKIPELREAQWYHDKSVPIPKTLEHEAPQTKIKQLRGKMVRFETSLKGEISVFDREVDTGIDVLVRSEAGDEMELFNHPETSSLLEAIISDGFVSLHFE
ncbi:MAG: hypothetical protein VX116_01110 [Candidatus Thermoplasmatota archaeon]|nr:hypothetical protein [Candidatus Thermoplasmatota archaeon]